MHEIDRPRDHERHTEAVFAHRERRLFVDFGRCARLRPELRRGDRLHRLEGLIDDHAQFGGLDGQPHRKSMQILPRR